MSDQRGLDVFISYAHEDEELRDALSTRLSILRDQGLIHAWHDRRITAGGEWEGQIHESLESADIVLLLISADFLASKYCQDVEMRRIMERHEEGTARVIPILLREVGWGDLREAPFNMLQPLPAGRPVKSWPDQDEALTDVANGLRRVIEHIQRCSSVSS